ncbi:hypothetical protein DL769_002080 [Monosporascus sp. CRB-8-3]|nr:hypothetical protein DL769_002080 [Monosporascus sp. CRB-8-3]
MCLPHHPVRCSDAIYEKAKDTSARTGIQADLLIPGRGEQNKNGAVVIHDARIEWIGNFDSLPSRYGAVTFMRAPVLMPGMILEAGFTGIRELSEVSLNPMTNPARVLIANRRVLERTGRRRARDWQGRHPGRSQGGARSLEHGCYLDEEVADMMKVKGAVLAATRHIQEGPFADPRDLRPKAIEEIEKLIPLSRPTYRLVIRRGVKIALWTDTYSSNPEHPLAHGKNATELRYAVKAGMTLLQAIEACTATPPPGAGRARLPWPGS